eukprot:751228-Hanusia_phi.AAC.3
MAKELSSERRSRSACDHLLDLPSSGLLVTFEPDQNEFKVMVGPSYLCTHDTSPPNGGFWTTVRDRSYNPDRSTNSVRGSAYDGQYKLDREVCFHVAVSLRGPDKFCSKSPVRDQPGETSSARKISFIDIGLQQWGGIHERTWN